MALIKRKKSEPGALVFVRPRAMGGAVAVLDSRIGHHVVLEPGTSYPADHPLVIQHPWLFLTVDEHHAAQRGTLTEVNSVRIDGGEDLQDLARQWAEAQVAVLRRQAEMTPQERAAAETDPALAAFGSRFEDAGAGPAVRMQSVDDQHVTRSQAMFTRRDSQWVELFGLVEGVRLCGAERSSGPLPLPSAMPSSRMSASTSMATAEAPFDTVEPGNEPLSVEAAREAYAVCRLLEVQAEPRKEHRPTPAPVAGGGTRNGCQQRNPAADAPHHASRPGTGRGRTPAVRGTGRGTGQGEPLSLCASPRGRGSAPLRTAGTVTGTGSQDRPWFTVLGVLGVCCAQRH